MSTLVKLELAEHPRSFGPVGDVVAVDGIDHNAPVVQHVCLRVMSLADAVLHLVWAAQLLTRSVKHRAVRPEHVALAAVLRPSAYVHVVQSVLTLQDVATPEADVILFNAVVHIALAYRLSSPVGSCRAARSHGLEAVHVSSTHHQLLPFSRTLAFLHLSLGNARCRYAKYK